MEKRPTNKQTIKQNPKQDQTEGTHTGVKHYSPKTPL